MELHDEPRARDIAPRGLDQLGFASWTVTVDETRPPDGDALVVNEVEDPAADCARRRIRTGGSWPSSTDGHGQERRSHTQRMNAKIGT